MNIIRMRQEERAHKISDLRSSIQKAIEENKKISYEDIILSACSNLNISSRTAKEYVKIALFELGIEKKI